MKLQYLKDSNGNDTAVLVSIDDWKLIKNNYPDIEELEVSVPQWEKDLIDSRLETIANNPNRLKPIESLLSELKKEI